MKKSLTIPQENFISGSDLIKDGENLFEKNGIYATEKYHELIATRLLEKIFPTIDKIAAPNSTLPKAGRNRKCEEQSI